MVSQVNVAPIGVLPLKVLATRDVIRERMDYKDCIGGKLREELDGLTRFEGKFIIDTSELEVLWRGEKLSKEEWKYMKSRLPTCVISFLDGKQDFSVLEKTGISGEREWDLQDIDGSSKLLQLSSRITKESGGWGYREQFFADGGIVSWRGFFNQRDRMVGSELDTFEIHDRGIVRTKIWTLPKLEMEITKEIFAHKENKVPPIFPFSFFAPVAQVGKYIIQMWQKKSTTTLIRGPVEFGLNQYL